MSARRGEAREGQGLRLLLLAGLAGLGASACGGSSIKSCVIDADCGGELACNQGRCVSCGTQQASCANDADCCNGFACTTGVCAPLGAGSSGSAGSSGTSGSAGSAAGSAAGSTTGGNGSTVAGSSSSTGGGSSGGTPGSSGGSSGCGAVGAGCAAGSGCCSQYCLSSVCTCNTGNGRYPCQGPSDCCEGYACSNGLCYPNASPTTSGGVSSGGVGTTSSGATTSGGSANGGSTSGGGTTTGGSSGSTTGCTPYGGLCSSDSCCSGLTCDLEAGGHCYVSPDQPCGFNELDTQFCLPPYTCDFYTGLCDETECLSYGGNCADPTFSCCNGFACDVDAGICELDQYAPCAGTGESCAPPYLCDPNTGTCSTGASACFTYGETCPGGICCAGLSCDTGSGFCLLAYDQPCSASGEGCAPPYTCDQGSGLCDTYAGCVGYGASCAVDSCCNGFSCDQPTNSCLRPPGASCTGLETKCANGGTCSAGVCVDEPCAAYGASCATTPCCGSGLACDTATALCDVAPGYLCEVGTTVCADGQTCTGSYCTGTGCATYGQSCATSLCCTGLACDNETGECLLGPGAFCQGNEACANGNTCQLGTCQPPGSGG